MTRLYKTENWLNKRSKSDCKISFGKKILTSILALAIFLLPVSPSFEINSNIKKLTVTTNKTYAGEAKFNLIKLNKGVSGVTDTTANFAAVVMYTEPVLDKFGDRVLDNPYAPPTFVKGDSKEKDKYLMIVSVHEGSYKKEGTPDVTGKSAGYYEIPFAPDTEEQTLQIPLVGLTANTDYFFSATIHTVSTDLSKNTQNAYENFTTTTDANTKGSGGNSGNAIADGAKNQPYELGCSLLDGMDGIIGCVAGFLYYVIWEVSALVAKLGGMFLDFLVYYSTNSTSYKSEFVTNGWKAIRDVANIFFIIALLYIAIKMILSMADHHSKKLISTIIIVALLINFSLFFTQVIIDGSNILAKVFYNNISSKYSNGDIANTENGEKSISIGLVDKYDPQKIINSDAYQESRGTFIFVTILLIAITLYTAYIFFTVGMLFVSRVVMLWFSMIFAPVAFASYTLPFDIPGLGHREWWKNLLENAFLAPLFIFMLYLIVMFTGELKKIISYPDGANWMIKMMSVIIPFIILSILLMKAKEMAVKYAGEMGAAMQKAGAMIGGVAVGAATGGAAMLGRGTLGRWGSMIGNSEKLKELESKGKFAGFMAARLRDTGSAAGKGSFDVRGIKVAGKSLASTGLQVGSAQTGGFEKRRADQVAKRQRRAESLKMGEDSEEKQALNKTDADLHSLNAAVAADIASIDNDIEGKTKDIIDINNKIKAAADGSPEKQNAQAELKAANDFIKDRKDAKKNLRNGKAYTTIKRDQYGNEEKDANGNTIIENKSAKSLGLDENGTPIGIRQLEDLKKNLTFKIEKEEHHRLESYAKAQASATSQTIDFVTSMGQHSFRGAREAEHKIRTGAKVPSAPTKDHSSGGGHSGGSSHGGGASHGGGSKGGGTPHSSSGGHAPAH